jgi:hypothetical protein
MLPRIPEKNKKAGVCYAVTDDGLELPIIDVTHPAFALQLSDLKLDELLRKHLEEVKGQAKVPGFIWRLMMGFMQRRSFLMRGIAAAAGTYMSGINTYILKLGPNNLNSAYASDIDRKVAASLPSLSVRLRVQDIAHFLADGLYPVLEVKSEAALHILNIGGGPAIDSLNAVIVLQKEHPDTLNGRRIFIHTLDLDEAGPRFGARALTSLMEDNGPLHGLDVRFNHVKYDWSDTKVLRELVNSFDDEEVVVATSTEGALFEYGADEEITTNLRILHEITPPEAIVAGTVTRADDIGRIMNSASQAAIKLRGLDAFTALANRAGWEITKRIDLPLSHDILLKKV